MSLAGLIGLATTGLSFSQSLSYSTSLVAPVPTLSIDFTSGVLDSRITFTRASTATYRDSTGARQTAAINVARFDHTAAGVARGLLLEIERTNLLLNSATLSTQDVAVTEQAYTLSFEGTGTVTLTGASTAGPLVGTGATDRVSLTFTPAAGTLTLTVSGTIESANLEAGSFATSWIPTTGTSATRSRDIPSLAIAGWFNQNVGTFVAEIEDGRTTSHAAAIFRDASNAIGLLCARTATLTRMFRQGASAYALADIASSPVNASTTYRVAGAYDYDTSTQAYVSVSGSAVTSATGAGAPVTAGALQLGGDAGFNDDSNYWLRRLTYFPQRLSNAQLQALTA